MMFKFPEKMPEKFCIAPFQSTRQNAYGRTSPCAFGAGEWRFESLTPEERWNSIELNDMRQSFINGEQPIECDRCWKEEAAGKKSLRQRQLEYYPNDYEDFIKTNKWLKGPKTAVFKTSNICNLACRSCAGWDSNTYTKEGQHYARIYDTRDSKGNLHNRFIPLAAPKHTDFMSFIPIMDNIEKIDFFGGEPLLNTTQLDLLEYLVDQGLSKKITLFYSTNCTNKPTERLMKYWSKFKRLEFSLSIDGIEDKFEYLRWPGKWNEAEKIIKQIVGFKDTLDCDVFVLGAPTISNMNVYYSDELINWHLDNIGHYYINMVNSPGYLSINILPDEVKEIVRSNISIEEVRNYLDTSSYSDRDFSEFITWMKRQDLYRNQRFESVFPEFYNLIESSWNKVSI